MRKSYYTTTTNTAAGGGCCLASCWLWILGINLVLGGFCTNFSLKFIFGVNIFWLWDILIGLFLGEFTIPIAVICWILSLVGYTPPLLHPS